MSFKLPTVRIAERHDWVILLKDEFRKEDVLLAFPTKEEAEKKLKHLVARELCTEEGKEIEIPEWP